MTAEISFPHDEPTDEERAVQARHDHAAALRREYAGYVQRGMSDRAKGVAAALKQMGLPLASQNAAKKPAAPTTPTGEPVRHTTESAPRERRAGNW